MSVKIVTKQAATESVELYRNCGASITIVVHNGASHQGVKTCLQKKEAHQLRSELDKLIEELWPKPKPEAPQVEVTAGGAYVLTGLPNITVTLTTKE